MTSMNLRRISAGVLVAAISGSAALARSGSTQGRTDASAITPFKIQVPNAVLTDLKQRLSQARFADEFPDADWDYGMNLAYLKRLTDYWRDKYDWRAQEKKLNELAQFRTTIDGIDIHFVHQRSKNGNATPLLLLNGWPSSIVEYMKVVQPLTDPVAFGGRAEDSFHVVIPSMPGYGFSGKPRERGFSPERIARMWIVLMDRLGYRRYVTHGSDWGNVIANRVALGDAAHVAGLHLAGCGGAPAPSTGAAAPPAVNRLVNGAHNLGYQEIQATKPQTLGHGLSDSPIGLASWIVEKWFGWSDHDGDLERIYTKDELLTNVMIYWVTNSGTSSARLYFESRHATGGLAPTLIARPETRVTVPTGCGAFPSQYDRRGIALPANAAEARKAAETRFNIVHFTTMPRGGHFPAIEQPQLWVDDIRAFVRTARSLPSTQNQD